MPNWTEEQESAIRDRGHTLLVAAGAGSGKTAVLVERIIGLVLEDRVDVDRLLVMTFTNAAAGELRERIAERLEAALQDAQDSAFVSEQMDRLGGAQISTIHSFCGNLIKRYFNRLDIDPRYRLMDDDERSLLEEEVLHQVMETYYAQGPSWFLELGEQFPAGHGDTGLRRCLLDLDRFLIGQPHPEEWLEEQLQDWEIQKTHFRDSRTAQRLQRTMQEAINRAELYFMTAQKIAFDQLPFYKSALDSDRTLLFELRQAATEDLQRLFETVGKMSFAHLKAKPRNFDGDPETIEAFQFYRNEMKRILKGMEGYRVGTMRQMEEMADSICRMLTGLRRVLTSYRRELAIRKRQDNVLTFDDLEHLALALLEDETLCEEVRNSYSYVFIDEYQDTSLVQEAILQRVSGENNLFMVGDMKQSIYRFRQAAPEVFQNKKHRFLGEDSVQEKLISLNRNFRCSDPIVQTVNHLFSRLMSPSLGEIDYDEVEKLNYGQILDEEDTPVSFVFLDKDEETDEDSLYKDLDYMGREALAAAAMLKEEHGKLFYDHKEKRRRPLDWKDMVVILRTPKNWGDQYLEVFRKEEIPAYKDSPLGYFEVTEIQVLVNMLRLIDNRQQDGPWLSLLRSPVIGLSDEQLAGIRSYTPEGPYSMALDPYRQNHDNEASDKIRRAAALLQDWQNKNRFLSLDLLIQHVLKTSDWYSLAGAMPGGEQRQANIRLFLTRAKAYGQSHLGGLKGFLRWYDGRKDRESDPGVATTVGEGADVVRIMSAHRSKGLEYPVVLIGALGKQFNLSDAQDHLLMHKELGLGPRVVDLQGKVTIPTANRMLIRDAILSEGKSEELRIMYVAATRAKNRLIFLGGLKRGQWEKMKFRKPEGIVEGRSWGDWVAPLLGEKLPPCMQVIYWNDQSQLRMERRRREDRQQNKERLLQALQGSPEDGQWLHNWNQAAMKEKGSGHLPAKLAVTDLYRLRQMGEMKAIPRRVVLQEKPRFLEGTKSPTGLERGLALHQVMQQLDLTGDLSAEGVNRQIESMTERELLTQEEAEWVSAPSVSAFFAGEIGSRLLRSAWVKREVPFNLRMEADRIFPESAGSGEMILVQGVIDLVFGEEDGLVLLDYKTDSPENIHQHYDRYRQQLGLYREALEKILKQPVKEVILYLFSTQEAIRLEGSNC